MRSNHVLFEIKPMPLDENSDFTLKRDIGRIMKNYAQINERNAGKSLKKKTNSWIAWNMWLNVEYRKRMSSQTLKKKMCLLKFQTKTLDLLFLTF